LLVLFILFEVETWKKPVNCYSDIGLKGTGQNVSCRLKRGTLGIIVEIFGGINSFSWKQNYKVFVLKIFFSDAERENDL